MRPAEQKVVNAILEALESGTVPWARGWSSQLPANLISGKDYRGVNALVLGFAGAAKGYSTRWWLTYNQAKTLGGHVRKGEKGQPIVLYRRIEKERNGKTESIPMLRSWTVFNLDQIEAEDGKLAKLKDLAEKASPVAAPSEVVEACETVRDGYLGKKGSPELAHGGDRAYYMPSADCIQLPMRGAFKTDSAYFRTLFHEMGHSTGHKSRLGRPGVSGEQVHFGSEVYGKEELVAELTAAFLSAHCGIGSDTVDQSAAYLAGWLKAIKRDPSILMPAASAAQKAKDLILEE